MSRGLLLLLLGLVSAQKGVDMSTDVYISPLQCLRGAGYDFIVSRCWQSNGVPDPNAVHTIYNAVSAGYAVDDINVYMFPCPLCSASAADQVNAAVKALTSAKANFSTFWLDIEDTSSHSYWGTDTARSQAWMDDLIVACVNAVGKSRCGVYASTYMWGLVFGDEGFDCCSAYPLWYADYDGAANCDSFSGFGGWSRPSYKQWQGTTSTCGADVDLNVKC